MYEPRDLSYNEPVLNDITRVTFFTVADRPTQFKSCVLTETKTLPNGILKESHVCSCFVFHGVVQPCQCFIG